jgi:ubiquinone biosynthesis protein
LVFSDLARLPRNLQRLGEIIVVFARHGFGPLISRLNLQAHIPIAKRWLAHRATVTDKELSPEKRVTRAFQELGTTFVKLGQVLSSRPDLVGESFATEFRRLRDQVEPFDPVAARAIIEEQLGRPIDEVFRSFDDEPAGCGSIAQVHRAELQDGSRVMVKVRRPGIESAIMSDMALLRFVAGMAESQLPELRPAQIVEEFDRAVRNELDFTVEASSTARFHETFEADDGIRCPQVYWDFSTAAVLTVERLDGIRISDRKELERRGYDPRKLAGRLTDCFITQYFRMGMFHADPHSGNFIILDGGVVGMVDFGMVGHLGPDTKARLSSVLIAASKEDIGFLADTAPDLGAAGEEFDP